MGMEAQFATPKFTTWQFSLLNIGTFNKIILTSDYSGPERYGKAGRQDPYPEMVAQRKNNAGGRSKDGGGTFAQCGMEET